MTITSSSLWEWRKVQSLFLFPQRIGITNPACGVLNYSHKEMQICPISKKLDTDPDDEPGYFGHMGLPPLWSRNYTNPTLVGGGKSF